MSEIRGSLFLYGGLVKIVDDFKIYCNPRFFGVYEVIRLIDGIPLFCEDHFKRMQLSLKLQGVSISFRLADIEQQICSLSEANQILEGNIKVVVCNETKNLVMFFIPHSYPSELDYKHGVITGLFHAERINPQIKTHLLELKKTVNEYLVQTGFYEIIYVDQEGLITEGSRSNIFFVKDDILYTCQSEKVLLGITRQKVLECINTLGLVIQEKAILAKDLSKYDSAFITGTSPRVLPIAKIDSYGFDTQNHHLHAVLSQYNRMIDRYIQDRKQATNINC